MSTPDDALYAPRFAATIWDKPEAPAATKVTKAKANQAHTNKAAKATATQQAAGEAGARRPSWGTKRKTPAEEAQAQAEDIGTAGVVDEGAESEDSAAATWSDSDSLVASAEADGGHFAVCHPCVRVKFPGPAWPQRVCLYGQAHPGTLHGATRAETARG